MEYKGYEVSVQHDSVIVHKIRDFNVEHTFECGQCFRWLRQDDGSYTGVAKGKVLNVNVVEQDLVLKNTNIDCFKNIWFDYFDLGRDYGKIKEAVAKDDNMKKATEFGWGIRLLKQDIWEALISFIISANNRIPRIMKSIGIIAKQYGEGIIEEFYSFPNAQQLAATTVEKLEESKAGFRCKYILDAAHMVNTEDIELEKLAKLSVSDAKAELMRIHGVGPKVADCVMLYSGTSHEVFPTDVWVRRVMEELYFNREASFKEIGEFATNYFGQLAGFAQQYLFYYARENKIGTSK